MPCIFLNYLFMPKCNSLLSTSTVLSTQCLEENPPPPYHVREKEGDGVHIIPIKNVNLQSDLVIGEEVASSLNPE